MSDSNDNVVQLAEERSKRIHDIHEKRATDLRNAFIKAFPLPKTSKAKPKSKKR